MPPVFYILFGSLFTGAVSYALGRLLLDRCRVRLYRHEQALFAFLCGASLLHLLMFTLFATALARKGVFLATGAAILFWAGRRGLLRLSAPPHPQPLSRPWKVLFGIIYLAYAVLYVTNAMAPEMSPDGSSYHLGLVGRYLRQRSFGFITTNMYASLSQGIEMLYAYAYSFGRHSAAAMVHALFTLSMPWLLLSYGRRIGMPAVGIGGALLFYCTPVVGIDGTTAYIDIAVAAVVFGVFYLLEIWREERQPGLVPVMGLLAGYCFSVKYTTALAIPFAFAWLAFYLWRSRKPWFRPLLEFCLCAALMVMPWLVKNIVTVGNPLSPFLNRHFPNPNVYISFEEGYVEHMRHYGEVQDYRIIPLDLTVHGERLSGMLGPVFLLTPLALLSLRFAEGRRLLLAALVFALPYASNIGTRFLLPPLPMLSLALAMAVARTPAVLPLLVCLHAILSWPHVIKSYASEYAWTLQRIPVAAALRLTSEEKYLNEHSHGYTIARMVEDTVPRGEKVFTFSGVSEAYTTREIITAYQSGFGNDLGEILWSAMYPEYGPVRHLNFTFPPRRVRRIRIRQELGLSGEWTAHEIRVLEHGHEIPRKPSWRVRAWPNPWLADYAVDSNPVTRWRPRQSATPGMFIDIDFGEELSLTEVRVEMAKDFPLPALQLFGSGEKGEWFPLAAQAESKDVALVPGLRGAAMDEFRRNGIRYLLVGPGDPGADDYKANGRLWGLHWIGERIGTRLYRIEEQRK